MFISFDVKLCSQNGFKYATVQSSTLNDDLGQVNYIFTDKTGTLTKNIMIFRKMTIGRYIYGQDFFDKKLIEFSDKYGTIKNFNFYDNEFLEHIVDDDHENFVNIKNFLLCICLCNTIFQENINNDEIVYHGTSPDEISMIYAARYFKYIFLKRISGSSGTKIVLEIFNQVQEFTINNYLEYNSQRYEKI